MTATTGASRAATFAPPPPRAAPARRSGSWWARQVHEVGGDPALRAYGAVLALLNFVGATFWIVNDVMRSAARDIEPICWPLVPACQALRVLPYEGLLALAIASALGSLVVALLFGRRATVGWAMAGLAALLAVKLFVLALDYRLRLNQHYMATAVTLAFLLVPRRRDALRILLVLVYFWAGTIKLNREWISGAALYAPLWLVPAGAATSAACVYVVGLELGVTWGLIARRAWVFWGALAQFLLFHVMSWAIVGFYYPMLMFFLLAIFPIARLVPPADDPALLRRFFTGRAARGAYVVAAVFSLMQLAPYAYPGDSALTGEGRLYALHMFDARVSCEARATVHHRDGSTSEVNLALARPVRHGCDPIVVANRARNLCEGRGAAKDVAEVDVVLRSRRTTEREMVELVNERGVCAKPLRFDPFRHNEWLRVASR